MLFYLIVFFVMSMYFFRHLIYENSTCLTLNSFASSSYFKLHVYLDFLLDHLNCPSTLICITGHGASILGIIITLNDMSAGYLV